jgi:hypothetical protein
MSNRKKKDSTMEKIMINDSVAMLYLQGAGIHYLTANSDREPIVRVYRRGKYDSRWIPTLEIEIEQVEQELGEIVGNRLRAKREKAIRAKVVDTLIQAQVIEVKKLKESGKDVSGKGDLSNPFRVMGLVAVPVMYAKKLLPNATFGKPAESSEEIRELLNVNIQPKT